MTETVQFRPGVEVEFFDEGALVLDVDGTTVHRVNSQGAACCK